MALKKSVDVGDQRLIILLLRYGADINYSDEMNSPVIFRAIINENRDVLHVLLQCLVDIEKANNEGDSPLLFAIRVGNNNIIMDLLEAGQWVYISLLKYLLLLILNL